MRNRSFGFYAGIFVGLFLLLAILFSSITVITHQNEYTIIRQMGRIIRIEDTPGISFKIPLVQREAKLPKYTLMYDLPISDVITQDKKTLSADSFVLWRISDPQVFIQTLNGSISNAESRLESLTYNAMKNIISARSQAEVISGRDGELVADITNSVVDSVSQYGIELLAVETKHLDLPDDNKAAVYQRMISERKNIAAGYTAEGASNAQKIRSETDKQVNITISEAEAKAEMLIAEGEAEYMRILSNAYSDPDKAEFYNFVRALDAAKISLSNSDNVLFLSKDSPLVSIFYDAD